MVTTRDGQLVQMGADGARRRDQPIDPTNQSTETSPDPDCLVRLSCLADLSYPEANWKDFEDLITPGSDFQVGWEPHLYLLLQPSCTEPCRTAQLCNLEKAAQRKVKERRRTDTTR